jgi:hypothetical protein
MLCDACRASRSPSHDAPLHALARRAVRALYRRGEVAGGGGARGARPHRALGAAPVRAYAFDPEQPRWRRRAPPRRAGARRAAVGAGRRAGDDQGEHRHARRAHAAGHGGHRPGAGRRRRAAGRAAARGRRVCWPRPRCPTTACCPRACRASTAGAQPLGPAPEPRRQQRRRRRRRGGRLRPAAPRHRHRRLDPPAGRLVRRGRPQAQPRPRADRAALHTAAWPGR